MRVKNNSLADLEIESFLLGCGTLLLAIKRSYWDTTKRGRTGGYFMPIYTQQNVSIIPVFIEGTPKPSAKKISYPCHVLSNQTKRSFTLIQPPPPPVASKQIMGFKDGRLRTKYEREDILTLKGSGL